MGRDAEARFLAQGILGGFLRGTELVRLFTERAPERLKRILEDRPDSRWKPFVPDRKRIDLGASVVDYLRKFRDDKPPPDLYVSASIHGRCLGRRLCVSIGLWQIPDIANDGRAVLYLHADEGLTQTKWRGLQIPCEPTDRRVHTHDEFYLCLVPGKNIELTRDFGILLDELRGMLPRMLGKAA